MSFIDPETTFTPAPGRVYHIGRLPLAHAEQTLTLLLRLFGPGFAEALVAHSVPVRGAAAFRDLVLRLRPEDIVTLRTTFGQVCRLNGKPMSPDLQTLEFGGGSMGEMFAWLWECVKHNYTDFFEYARNVWRSILDTPSRADTSNPSSPSTTSP